MTREQLTISTRNNRRARKYFGIYGNKDLVLHHVDWTMRHNNIERYIQWNIEDLVVMTKSEHRKLHNKLQGNPFTFPEVIDKIQKNYQENWADKPRGTCYNISEEEWDRLQSIRVSHRNLTLWQTEEYRDKMMDVIDKMHESQRMPVHCITTNTTYKSIREATIDTGVSKFLIKKSADTGEPRKGLKFQWIRKEDAA